MLFISTLPVAKLQSLQTELSQTKRELADQQAEMSTLDERGVESAEQLEMAMLDKEVRLGFSSAQGLIPPLFLLSSSIPPA